MRTTAFVWCATEFAEPMRQDAPALRLRAGAVLPAKAEDLKPSDAVLEVLP